MSRRVQCFLCHEHVPDTFTTREHGADLCNSCTVVDPLGQPETWGCSVAVAAGRTKDGLNYDVGIEASAEGMRPMEAYFCKERLTHRFLKIVLDEPAAGDPLFDDEVWVEWKSDRAVEDLIGQEPAMGALLVLIRGGYEVYLEPGKVHAWCSTMRTRPAEPFVPAVCMLVRCLQALTDEA